MEASLSRGYSLVSVRLGEWDTSTLKDCDDSWANEVVCNDPPLDIPVTEKIVHEDYDPADQHHHHDIAILRLERSVSYTNFVRPICLPSSQALKTNKHVGETMVIAGYVLS